MRRGQIQRIDANKYSKAITCKYNTSNYTQLNNLFPSVDVNVVVLLLRSRSLLHSSCLFNQYNQTFILTFHCLRLSCTSTCVSHGARMHSPTFIYRREVRGTAYVHDLGLIGIKQRRFVHVKLRQSSCTYAVPSLYI